MEAMQRGALGKLLASFDSAVLVAQSIEGELNAHPVALGRFDEGVQWLACGVDGTPMLEPERRDAVMLICEHGAKHLVLSGGIALELDPTRARKEWVERWTTWFPDGPSSSSLVLSRFVPRSGEYWDHSGHTMRYVADAARSLVRGARVPLRREEHFLIV